MNDVMMKAKPDDAAPFGGGAVGEASLEMEALYALAAKFWEGYREAVGPLIPAWSDLEVSHRNAVLMGVEKLNAYNAEEGKPVHGLIWFRPMGWPVNVPFRSADKRSLERALEQGIASLMYVRPDGVGVLIDDGEEAMALDEFELLLGMMRERLERLRRKETLADLRERGAVVTGAELTRGH